MVMFGTSGCMKITSVQTQTQPGNSASNQGVQDARLIMIAISGHYREVLPRTSGYPERKS